MFVLINYLSSNVYCIYMYVRLFVNLFMYVKYDCDDDYIHTLFYLCFKVIFNKGSLPFMWLILDNKVYCLSTNRKVSFGTALSCAQNIGWYIATGICLLPDIVIRISSQKSIFGWALPDRKQIWLIWKFLVILEVIPLKKNKQKKTLAHTTVFGKMFNVPKHIHTM